MLPLPWHSNAIAATFTLCSPTTVADGPPQCCSCHPLIVACSLLFWPQGTTLSPRKWLPHRHHCTSTVCIQKRPLLTSFCHPAAITERRHCHRFPCAAMALSQPHCRCCLFCQLIVIRHLSFSETRNCQGLFLQDSAAAMPPVVRYAVRRLNFTTERVCVSA